LTAPPAASILASVSLIVFRELEVTLSDVDKFLLVEFVNVLENKFINGIAQEENFVALLQEFLDGWV
jgi:hypothetical protein